MITDPEFLDLLACPENQTPLTVADEATLDRLNRAIAAGRAKTRAGRTIAEPITAGLIRKDRTLLYPIIDDIPVLLVEEAIVLDETP